MDMASISERATKHYSQMLSVRPKLVAEFCDGFELHNANTRDNSYRISKLSPRIEANIDPGKQSDRDILNEGIGGFLLGFYGLGKRLSRFREDSLSEIYKKHPEKIGAEVLDWAVFKIFDSGEQIIPTEYTVGALENVKICAVLKDDKEKGRVPKIGSPKEHMLNADALTALFKMTGTLSRYQNRELEWVIAAKPVVDLSVRSLIDLNIRTKVSVPPSAGIDREPPLRRVRYPYAR